MTSRIQDARINLLIGLLKIVCCPIKKNDRLERISKQDSTSIEFISKFSLMSVNYPNIYVNNEIISKVEVSGFPTGPGF